MTSPGKAAGPSDSQLTEEPALEVRNLTVEFRRGDQTARAVDDVSFVLHRGRTLSILGESGSGKSVTALSIMSLVPPKAGRIVNGSVLLEGTDLRTLPPAAMRAVRGERIAMIFQDPLSSLNPVMTVGTQIGEMFRKHRRMSRAKARQQAIDLMELVRIPAADKRVDEYPHQFSGGMRQRVMIAMALALEPDVLIADEPTTALDMTVQAQIMQLLAELQREKNMGLILISHDLGTVAHVTDDVVVMYGGRVVESGPVQQVFQHPAHPYTQGLLASVPHVKDKGHRLVPISGAPPTLFTLPSGCAFHPRCPHAQDRCTNDVPPLRSLAVQASACHYAETVQATEVGRA